MRLQVPADWPETGEVNGRTVDLRAYVAAAEGWADLRRVVVDVPGVGPSKPWARFHDVRPSPFGRVPPIERARLLLARLLRAFTPDGAFLPSPPDDPQALRRVLCGAPSNAYAYARLHRAELRCAWSALVVAGTMLDAMAGRLPPPAEYTEQRQAIIDAWDAAVLAGRWRTLPPLCRECGRPVHARANVPGTTTLSVMCSEACRKARSWRDAKRKTKASGR